MPSKSVSTTSGRANGVRGRWIRQGLPAVAIAAAGALGLSACGSSPSASQTASQNLANGIAAQNAGDYAKAASYYSQVLKAEPKNAYALFDLGDVEQFQRQYSQAQVHYLAALSVSPHFVAAMYNLATIVATSNPAEAQALYTEVIALSPKNADAHFNLGFVLIALGHKNQGNAQIRIAVRLDPSLASRIPK